MGERRACPWWWWGWPRRRRRARRLLSRRRVPRRQLSRRRLSRRRFSRQRLSRREGVRRQARLRRQAVLPASWVLRARRVRRGGAGLRRRLLVRPTLLRVPVSLFVSVHGPFVYARGYARLYSAWARAASILVLVRRSRRLLPVRGGMPGRLAASSAAAAAPVLTFQRSCARPCVLSEGATSYPPTRTSATVRPYLSTPRDSTVTGPEASSRCKRSRAASSRRSPASTPRTR